MDTTTTPKPTTKKHAGGRPLLFKSPKELQDKIDIYFDECKKNKSTITTKDGVLTVDTPLIPTIAGLAYALNTDRHTIYNYEQKDEYFHIIKKARDFIFSQIESKLQNSNTNAAGTIFLLKNYGYSDKQEIETTVKNQPIGIDFSKISMDDIAQLSNLLSRLPVKAGELVEKK